MGKFFHALVFAASSMLASHTVAQDRPVVVELFTSQGCSSCPPADAFLHELAKRSDVIALALHVDYWDYIGWKDSFADPAYTQRQRGYARVQGERVVYTPQMMINGVEHAVGNRKREVSALVAKYANEAPVVAVSANLSGGTVLITLSDSRTSGDFNVHLVSYAPSSTVNIKRGENAGRTISYANVVTNWQTIGRWNGRGQKQLREAVPANVNHVVLVQKRGHREIIGAVRVQ